MSLCRFLLATTTNRVAFYWILKITNFLMESQIRKSELCRHSLTTCNKAEIDLLKAVGQFRQEHRQFIAKLESNRQSIKTKMEEYSARKREIYQDRVTAYQRSGNKRDLGPFYRKPKHYKPERDDVYQSGVIYHGLLHPGAFPHNVDMKRRKSYQDTVSLRKETLVKMNAALLQQQKKRLSEAGLEFPRRTKSAPPLEKKQGKWTDEEDKVLSRVNLNPKQYLLVLTPKNHRGLRSAPSDRHENYADSARLLASRDRRYRIWNDTS
uniref:Uncharacterized protein n=1 Tax=Capitella teleta TaxID=283909 RepID=X2AIS2_CAPTE